MEIKFNDITWHDAELLNITIDRSNAGYSDQVIIDICWQNGEISKLVFDDCYKLEAEMNFGVIGYETILDASFTDESQELTHIREIWSRIGADLTKLKCFEIQTNSTASILRIYALSCSLQNGDITVDNI